MRFHIKLMLDSIDFTGMDVYWMVPCHFQDVSAENAKQCLTGAFSYKQKANTI